MRSANRKTNVNQDVNVSHPRDIDVDSPYHAIATAVAVTAAALEQVRTGRGRSAWFCGGDESGLRARSGASP
jgi:hypothetical protein